jgi:hypothetical protein
VDFAKDWGGYIKEGFFANQFEIEPAFSREAALTKYLVGSTATDNLE